MAEVIPYLWAVAQPSWGSRRPQKWGCVCLTPRKFYFLVSGVFVYCHMYTSSTQLSPLRRGHFPPRKQLTEPGRTGGAHSISPDLSGGSPGKEKAGGWKRKEGYTHNFWNAAAPFLVRTITEMIGPTQQVQQLVYSPCEHLADDWWHAQSMLQWHSVEYWYNAIDAHPVHETVTITD